MTAQLSWQPPPVTKCGECPNKRYDMHGTFCFEDTSDNLEAYKQNKDGITPTCPMWQEQNKDSK